MYENYEGLSVPSLNRTTGKIEWKPIIAAMKRDAPVIEIESSLTGRMSGNTLKLTLDHKMITIDDAEFVDKKINDLLKEGQMLLCAQKIPGLTEATQKQKELAYLLGAISTDGSIYTSRTHGEVQFIQKETEEKVAFIAHVNECLEQSYDKSFKKSIKNTSSGEIRGKPVIGNANAYRCYSKHIAYALLAEQKTVTQTLLQADLSVVFSFLAGVIDGDGSYNKEARRVNIYCSKQYLLEAIVVSCLRVGIVPQISTNRSIWNVQIVEQLDEIFKWTKRVKGETTRKRQGTRFFSAKQMLEKSGYIGRFSASLQKNLYLDAKKLQTSLGKFSEMYKERITRLLASDTRMQRVSFSRECGTKDVYNISVADNHNYIVFTERFTPVLVNNCHAAIISRELGVPCVVGTNNATEKIKNGQKVTVDCSTGEKGIVYDGLLKF
ncbi:MAG: PEP-utilizing enzyme, partial [Nanoarchaeota archaeon]